jgi:hypothetical protein
MGIAETLLVSAGEVEAGNGVANEKADSLGSAVLVAACGALVAVLRNRAEIVLAHLNRQSPKSAALAHPRGIRATGNREQS